MPVTEAEMPLDEMRKKVKDLGYVCADCGDTHISVECVVIQNKDGELVVTSICDDGHTCNVCEGEHITEKLTTDAALKEIQRILDRNEWDAETADQIAQVVRRTGRPVREPLVDEPDEEDEVQGDPLPEGGVDTTQCQTNDWCTLPEAHKGPCRDVHDRTFGPRYGAKDAS